MDCLTPPLEFVPIEEWFCPTCRHCHPTAADGRGAVVGVQDEEEVRGSSGSRAPRTREPRGSDLIFSETRGTWIKREGR